MNKKNVISFLNMKGGVGKTTLCKEIAYYLSEKEKKKILVIDIDPQSNCTQSFFEKFKIFEGEDIKKDLNEKREIPSIQNIFKRTEIIDENVEKEKTICKLSDTLDIIPGELETIFMERETSGSVEQKLYNFIEDYRIKEEYDFIFIDCPPTYSFYTISSLLASDYYFVPLKPDIYSLFGLDLLERVIKEITKSYRANFRIKSIQNLGVIFTMIKEEQKGRKIQRVKQIKENKMFKNMYFFKNNFRYYDKINTSKLQSFILDRKDKGLMSNLDDICQEFIERMSELNESNNKIR
ncbi:ParA family protein [Leptotrichia sp. oral taxon 879]|uniref:ParA family protein n=1 Tax=Leptotrichia sp. oral taxon 879 TaxID=1227267 RepID=UPI0003AE2E74|nr:AAA family ATPase [Leptotrichia sp. oral taxon 879]ERK52435.1 CobQ/CobB/MinD/ParA nucleotide binding domain protein [Leptotrichia sp. oral taxon 879 str. F0557]